MMRGLVESRGARFLVGLPRRDEPELEAFLDRQKIPHASFDDAESGSLHWTPNGHRSVARGLMTLLSEAGVLDASRSAQSVSVQP